MDVKRGRSLLRDLLLLLPKDWWWPVNVQSNMDIGIGKVVARPVLEIEALLSNASFGKKNKHEFTFVFDKFILILYIEVE